MDGASLLPDVTVVVNERSGTESNLMSKAAGLLSSGDGWRWPFFPQRVPSSSDVYSGGGVGGRSPDESVAVNRLFSEVMEGMFVLGCLNVDLVTQEETNLERSSPAFHSWPLQY